MNIRELKQIIHEEIRYVLNEEHGSVEDLSGTYKSSYDENFIAYNESYWQWEYDTSITHAFLYERNSYLRLVIVNEHIKSGIGKGTRYTTQLNELVGTIQKPQLAKIRTFLKQHSHNRTRASYGFQRQWHNPLKNYEKEDLTSILKEYQNV